MWYNFIWVKLYFFIIFYSEKPAIVIEQMDELIRIKFENENEEKRKIWIETDDPKIKIKELYDLVV